MSVGVKIFTWYITYPTKQKMQCLLVVLAPYASVMFLVMLPKGLCTLDCMGLSRGTDEIRIGLRTFYMKQFILHRAAPASRPRNSRTDSEHRIRSASAQSSFSANLQPVQILSVFTLVFKENAKLSKRNEWGQNFKFRSFKILREKVSNLNLR